MAQEIVRHWQRRVVQVPHADEQLFLALLFMMLRTPIRCAMRTRKMNACATPLPG